MAFEYFLYDTNFSNTLVDRSNNSFAPLPPNTGEIFIDFLIPNTQPLYLYRESGATIVLNDQATIDAYLNSTNPPSDGSTVNQGEFTGYTATTEIQIQEKVEWEGEWTGGTYLRNDMSSDNGWTMIANKDTDDRPSPQAVGDSRYLYEIDNLIITGATGKQLVYGMQYSSPVPYWVSGYRINVVAGNNYEVILIIDAGGANEVKFINNFTAEVTGWRDFGLVPKPENSGTTYQILAIVHQPDPTPITLTRNYNYTKTNNATSPIIGQITHANKDLSSLLINYTDNDSNNNEAMLTGLTVGDFITIAGTQWSIQNILYLSTYVDFTIAPARQSVGNGITEVEFETTIPTAISYGEDESYWSGNTNINGVFGIDTGWEDAILDDSQYGVDILVQEAYISPDWDFISTAGDGGGSVTNNAIWGTIEGDITNQTDLQAALDAKIDKVTGATNNIGTFLDDGNLEDSGFSVDDLLTGGTDVYVSGATLVGDVLNLERTEGQPNVTADLSAITNALQQNSDDIQLVSGVTETNEINISANTDAITINNSDIIYLSGQTDTKLNINDFNIYSGLTETEIATKIDKVVGATGSTIPTFVVGGNIEDSGKEFTITIGSQSLANNNKIPTELAVRNAIESAVAGAVQLQGDWNALTNTPDLTVTGITTGYAWRVSVSGNTNLNGITDWAVGDLAIKSATGWIKIENQNIAAIWGNIGGLLSDQTDLQLALDAKLNITSFNIYTGDTNTRLNGIESDIQLVSGETTQNAGDIVYLSGQTDTKIDKVTGATGNLAIFLPNGNVEDSGVTIDSITGGTGFYYYNDRTATINNGSTTDIIYLSGTSNILTAGVWSIDFNAVGGNSSPNKAIVVGFYIDNVLQGVENVFKTNDANVVMPFVITKDLLLTNATHTFEIRFRQSAGGTAFIDYGAVRARIVN